MAPTRESPFGARRPSGEVELEELVAQVTDQAEYWKSAAEHLERVVGELRAERDRLEDERELAEAWRRALAAELLDLARSNAVGPEPVDEHRLGGVVIGLPLALLLWTLLGALAYGGYRLFAG